MSFVDGSQPSLAPHPNIQGLFIKNDNTLWTKNLLPGEAYGDEALFLEKDIDGTEVEYREWNPSNSKLAKLIISNSEVDNLGIKPGSHVFFAGVECGTTISHISDIVGPEGMVYVSALTLDKLLRREIDDTLMKLAAKRCNIAPIVGQIDSSYQCRMFITVVDVMFMDGHLDNQDLEMYATEIATLYLKDGGHYVIRVKASMGPLFERTDLRQLGFTPLQHLTLNEDHAYNVGVFRMPKLVQNPTSSTSSLDPMKTWGMPFIPFDEMPTYFLFETPYGLSLIQTRHGLKKVGEDPDYEEAAKLGNRFDDFFEVSRFEPFESPSERHIQCKSLFKEGAVGAVVAVTSKVKKFLELNLPKSAYDESRKPCYTLVVPSVYIADPIFLIIKCRVVSGPFYNDIMRAFRMIIGKLIPARFLPIDLKKEQRDMALAYSNEIIKEATQSRKSKGKRKVLS